MAWKGFLANKKKGSLSPVLEADVFVTEKPQKPHLETDPTVPQYVKEITSTDIQNWITAHNKTLISGSITGDKNKTVTMTCRDGSVLQFSFADNEGVALDDVLDAASFDKDTGVWTFITSEGKQVTASNDGRYSLLGHTHDFDKYGHWNLRTNGVQRKMIKSTDPVDFIEGDFMKISYVTGGGIRFDSTVKIPGGTINVSASRNLTGDDNGKTLLISGENIVLTVPTGLGKDFACNFMLLDPATGVCQIIAGTGFTLKAPLGNKLLVDYTASLIKETDTETGHLRGELTP